MTPLLRATDLVVVRNRRRVLDGISLNVHAGEVVALLGRNGAGKSTLLEVLLGARRPECGTVLIGDQRAASLTSGERARRVTLVAQGAPADLALSVEDLVTLGLRVRRPLFSPLTEHDRARVAAALVELGLDRLRSRRIDSLSGGERQRAHLARALAQGAPLLLLDEPTAHLDVRQQLELLEFGRRHAQQGGAAVIATHDLSLAARFATRGALLVEGRWLANGRPECALTAPTLAHAFGIQARVAIGSTGGVEQLVVLGRAEESEPC